MTTSHVATVDAGDRSVRNCLRVTWSKSLHHESTPAVDWLLLSVTGKLGLTD